MPRMVPCPSRSKPVHAVAPLHDVELKQRGLPETGDAAGRSPSVANSGGTSA